MPKADAHQFFETFSALTRQLRAALYDELATLEVGSAQAKFLRHVGLHGKISQADLARATQTAPSLTGRALEPLIGRGWVKRTRSKEDKREYVLELTASGRRACDEVEAARDRVIARVTAPLDARDLADFERVAGKLASGLAGED